MRKLIVALLEYFGWREFVFVSIVLLPFMISLKFVEEPLFNLMYGIVVVLIYYWRLSPCWKGTRMPSPDVVTAIGVVIILAAILIRLFMWFPLLMTILTILVVGFLFMAAVASAIDKEAARQREEQKTGWTGSQAHPEPPDPETSTPDHYQTLGVSGDATQEEIRKAYLNLMKKHHPDMNGGKQCSFFHDLSDAYEVLGDEEKRQRYDSLSSTPVADTSHHMVKCFVCVGKGSLFHDFDKRHGTNDSKHLPCPMCRGKGWIPSNHMWNSMYV